jgi:adenosylcobinamide kinase/adenosylcobinamide-phosphate guanylyltransferase
MTILVIGGSGSGKSAYGEDRAVQLCSKDCGQLFYIATMLPYGEEGQRRVQRHQQMRQGKGFSTIECYTQLRKVNIPPGSTVLLECLANLTANEMFNEASDRENAAKRIWQGLLHLQKQSHHLIIIGNNVFDDGILYPEPTRTYIKNIGQIQNQLAGLCDEVVEVVHGIPLQTFRKDN